MAAASAEGLTPARTMRLAESLYMDGFISYPRVDNTVYPSSLDLRDILKRISGNPAYRPFAEELLKKDKLTATRGKTETTDHPPIHPTNLATPEMLPPAEYKLYNLIARRFMATLSEPAVIEGTKVTLEVNGEPFAAKGDVLVKPGFRAIYPYGLKKDEQLPALEEGEMLDFGGCDQDAQADRAARALFARQAHPRDGKAGVGYEIDPPFHHRAPLYGQVCAERPDRAFAARHRGHRCARPSSHRISPVLP